MFHIVSGKDVTISGLTVTNGSAPPPYNLGGGIYNDHATLTLSNCKISGNSTVWGGGGGIYNDGYGGTATLTITNCTISGNSTIPGAGGGHLQLRDADDQQQHSQRQFGRPRRRRRHPQPRDTDDH